MLTGEIRNQIDQIWNAFWSGGISNASTLMDHTLSHLETRALRGKL